MNPDRIAMSQRDRDTLTVLRPVLDGRRSQAEAARLLGKSIRQVRRLVARLKDQGDAGLIHKLRGQPSNRSLKTTTKSNIISFYKEHLQDFGPTLAAETLAEEGLQVGVETLRRWLTAEGLWQPSPRRDTHRSRRPRRACFGELIQLDASIHDWTEGRGEAMALSAMIDDATGRVLARFAPAETTAAYFDLLERWLTAHGRPVALYSDKKTVFRVPSAEGRDASPSQFGRACDELGIELIFAHSPQAKGRVERFFGTAQDRWVKQMRRAGVTTIAEANALVARTLLPHFNRHFTVAPAEASDAHRPWLRREHDLRAILCPQQTRVVSNDYVVRFEGRLLQLAKPATPGLRGGVVIVESRRDGTLAIRFRGRYLRFQEITTRPRASSPPRPREPSARPPHRPAPDHPWRTAFQPPKNG
jgi:transposase